MNPQYLEILINILIIVLALLLPIAAKKILALLELKVKNEASERTWTYLENIIRIYISAAEDLKELSTGAQRRDYVTRRVSSELNDIGISISPQQLDGLIRGIYQTLKNQNTAEIMSKVLKQTE